MPEFQIPGSEYILSDSGTSNVYRLSAGKAAGIGGSVVVADPHAKALFRIGQDGRVTAIHETK